MRKLEGIGVVNEGVAFHHHFYLRGPHHGFSQLLLLGTLAHECFLRNAHNTIVAPAQLYGNRKVEWEIIGVLKTKDVVAFFGNLTIIERSRSHVIIGIVHPFSRKEHSRIGRQYIDGAIFNNCTSESVCNMAKHFDRILLRKNRQREE